ncbi:MAG TPA: SDR family NAD(P)-dependent oxidoreductase [Stellaceae bacterium]|nr:SDR family NAD(P)-dependent oxidoreductase [Stellaceae bacterium]
MSDASSNPRPLDGRIALVTGASRGLGAAIARRFARAGAHLVLVARTVGGLEEVDDAVRAAGGQATLVPFDLTDFDKIDQLGAALYERFGRLDILIGNAAMLGALSPVGHIQPKTWSQVIDLDLTANWRLIRAMDPLLRQAPAGRAIFVTAEQGHVPTAYWGAYAVAKAGLEMLAKTWQAELNRTAIKVSVIDPGAMPTKLRREAFPNLVESSLPSPDAVAERFLELVL